MMEKVHAEAKTAAYAALTSAHAANVLALVSQVAAGSLDPRTAEQQIDALLTSDEKKSLRTAAETARHAMFEAIAAAGAGPLPMGPGMSGPPPGGPPGGRRFGRPSAGRYLLMVSIAPDQMRKLMPQARRAAAP